MRVVVALGGNALLRRGEPMTAELQRGNIRIAAQALAPVAREHQLVVSHGNGPQVGSWPFRPRPIPRSSRIRSMSSALRQKA